MDSLTQLTLGAAVGEAVLGKKIGNKAPLWGMFFGTLPDLDVLFNPWLDPVSRLAFHRGPSHALLTLLGLSLLLAWLFRWAFRKHAIAYGHWFAYFWLILLTHVLIDTFTTYGTQLFLPLTDYRASTNNVSIIDPLYTVPLLVGLVAAMRRGRGEPKRQRANAIGLFVSTLYMGITFLNKSQADQVFERSLREQGVEAQRVMSSPGFLSSVLWYCVAQTDSGFHVGHHSLFDKSREVEFRYYPRRAELLEHLSGSAALERLDWFSDGYWMAHQAQGRDYLIDLRMGMLDPSSEDPLEAFVFIFELERGPGGEVWPRQARPGQGRDDWSAVMGGLARRTFGLRP